MGGSLDDFLSRLPDGAVVALAVPAAHRERLAAARGGSFGAIGGPDISIDGRNRSSLAIVGVRGAHGKALVRTARRICSSGLAPVKEIGDTGVRVPAAMEVRSNATEAAIRQGSRDLVRTLEGAVMAVWHEDGDLEETFVLLAENDFRVQIPTSPLSVYPLRGVWPSQELSRNDWTDVLTSTRTGSIMLRVPANSAAVMYLGSEAPLAPRYIDRSSTQMRVDMESFESPDRTALHARLEADGLKANGLVQTTYAYRIGLNTPRR